MTNKIMYIDYSFYEMVFLFFFWGVIGWVIEVIDMKIEAGEFQNRGFLHMPICPLYGIGIPMLCVLLRSQRQSYLWLFLYGILLCSLLEYAIGWLLEKLFNARWWDYSHMRFNVRGRVCLRNSVLFGVGTLLAVGFVEPVAETVINKIPLQIGLVVCIFALIILVMDIAASVRRALHYREKADGGEAFVIFKSHR